MSYSVRIDGFKTKEQAEEFYKWYEGQGEQDILVWMEINLPESVNAFAVDLTVEPEWQMLDICEDYVFKIRGE